MRESTKKLTFGAMLVAIFGVLLIANRQTAGMFEEMFLYIFPIPMVAFSARYDLKNSLPVLVCMGFMAFLFGTFSTMFYAMSGTAVGMVLGTRIHRKRDMTHTLFLVMALMVIANLLSTYVLASLMGYDITAEIGEMESLTQGIFQKMIDQGNANGVSTDAYQQLMALMTPEYLRRMFLLSMICLGLVQGFLVFQLSLLILRRLRYPVPRPKALIEYVPPRWTGIVAAVLFVGYSVTFTRPLDNELLQNALQAGGMFGMMYLAVFGSIAVSVLLRRIFPKSGIMKILRVVIIVFLYLSMPQVLMIVGLFYISFGLRDILTETDKKTDKEKDADGEKGNRRLPAEGTSGASVARTTGNEAGKRENAKASGSGIARRARLAQDLLSDVQEQETEP